MLFRIARWFSLVAVLEGVSFLLLLFVAMPLKYLAGWPLAVSVVGAAHGALFVLYVLAALLLWFVGRRSPWWFVWAVLASVIPGATFLVDRQLRRERGLASRAVPQRASSAESRLPV